MDSRNSTSLPRHGDPARRMVLGITANKVSNNGVIKLPNKKMHRLFFSPLKFFNLFHIFIHFVPSLDVIV